MAKILFVEDDRPLCVMVESWLSAENHIVELLHNGADGLARVNFYKYDLVILDWELPGISGVELCRRMRSTGNTTPVLILTGRRKELKDKVVGLDSGADDYLTKPFDLEELSARIRALLRRPPQMAGSVLTAKDLVLDAASSTVTKNGRELQLFPKEFSILEFFMRHPNQVFSAVQLLNHVWPSFSDSSPDSVRPYITRIRAKIDTEGQPSFIRTVHGLGYKFQVPE